MSEFLINWVSSGYASMFMGFFMLFLASYMIKLSNL